MIVAMIEYKGYVGVFEFDEKTDLFMGKISNIKGLITFQGKTVENTKLDFKDVVNEYLSWCKKHDKEPEKPSSESNASEHMIQKTVER